MKKNENAVKRQIRKGRPPRVAPLTDEKKDIWLLQEQMKQAAVVLQTQNDYIVRLVKENESFRQNLIFLNSLVK